MTSAVSLSSSAERGRAASAACLCSRLAIGGALLPSCGGSSSPPTTSTPTTTLAAAPSPTPPGTVAASCSLGKGDPNADCTAASGTAHLQLYVETALDLLQREQPQLLDLAREEWPNSGRYYVKDVEGYLDAVVNNVRRQGACAERDPDSLQFRRVLVKDSNDFSEGFRLVSEKGYLQRGRDALDQYCDPASFPVDRSGDVPPAGSGCGKPYPPPIHHFNAKVHTPGIAYVTLDSTPVVGPDVVYCATIGYTDNRSYCPVRPETARSARPASPGGSGRPRTPAAPVPPGSSRAATAPDRRAAARTTPTTSTACSLTRTAPT